MTDFAYADATIAAAALAFDPIDAASLAAIKNKLGELVATDLKKAAHMLGAFPAGHPIRDCAADIPALLEDMKTVTPLGCVEAARRNLRHFRSLDDGKLDRLVGEINNALAQDRSKVSETRTAQIYRNTAVHRRGRLSRRDGY